VHNVKRLHFLKQRALCNNMIALKFETFIPAYTIDSGYFLQQNEWINFRNEILFVRCGVRYEFSFITQINSPERINRSRS